MEVSRVNELIKKVIERKEDSEIIVLPSAFDPREQEKQK